MQTFAIDDRRQGNEEWISTSAEARHDWYSVDVYEWLE
jgi:hypothetical protein